MAQQLRFNCMHFMPYAYLPENHKQMNSMWVNLPNTFYDPHKGHALYQRYLSELILADQLGYDAIVVNEHHNTLYSMMATPNLIAAALVPQTKRAKICVWGTPPNLMLPNRLAEEYAILDVMSGGVATAKKALELTPNDLANRIVLASAYVGLDRKDLAEQIGADIKRIDPAFSVAQFARAQPYRDTGVLETFVSDLRAAGLPD